MSPTFPQPRMRSHASHGDSEMFTECYDDLLPLIELIKLGKLHDIERWIADGKPLDLDPQPAKGARKKTPLQYAVDSGFHTVVETLLKSGLPVNGDPRCSAMGNALAKRRIDLVKLLCEFGYDARNVDMSAVFATWDPEIMEHLIDRGADPEKGMPLARALIERTRTALRVFKKYKDRFATFQEQANIALRLHCKEGNAKWVSLLLWAGADPCVRGEDDPDAKIDPDEPGATAIGYAMLGKHDDIVAMKQIKIPVDSPVMEDLFIYGCQGKALGVLESLLERGAVLNTASNGGCPGIQTILERFENNCMMGCVRHGSHFCNSSRGNDCDGCRDQMTAIELIAKHGGKWRPVDRHDINRARRALLKMTSDYTLEFVRTMSKYSAADIKDVEVLIGTPAIRARISHRGMAVRELLDEWHTRIEANDNEASNSPS